MDEGDFDWWDAEQKAKIEALMKDEIYELYMGATEWEIIDIRVKSDGNRWVIARNSSNELYKVSPTDKRDFQIGVKYNHVIRQSRVEQVVDKDEIHYRMV